MSKKKLIRSLLETLFLAIGLYYLFSIIIDQKDFFNQLSFSENIVPYSLAFLLYLLVYFYMIFAIDHVTKKHYPEKHAGNFMMLYSASSLSSLGKYIPGKIWSFLAFNNLGHKMGLPTLFLSSVFIINLSMAILTAGILLGLRFLSLPYISLWAFLIFLCGFISLNKLTPFLQNLTWLNKKNLTLPNCASTFWLIQWLTAFTSGFAYHLVASTFNEGRDLTFSSLTSYYLSYMSGYLAFFMPAGIGVREAVILALDGKDEASATVLIRVMTIFIDLLLAVPAFIFFFLRQRCPKISS